MKIKLLHVVMVGALLGMLFKDHVSGVIVVDVKTQSAKDQ